MVERFHCGHSDFYISKYPVYGIVLNILIQRLRTLLAHLAQHPADSLVDKVISHQRTYLQTADCRYRIPCRP